MRQSNRWAPRLESTMHDSHALPHPSIRDRIQQARIGAGPGFLAGSIFVIMLAALAAMNGATPFQPLYMFASLVMGPSVLQSQSVGALVAGTVITVTLSTLYGMVYTLINKPLMLGDSTNWPLQAALGALFGAVLWVINFQLFSRLFF